MEEFKDEALMIIETVLEWSNNQEPTEENLDNLIDVVAELLDDILNRKQQITDEYNHH